MADCGWCADHDGSGEVALPAAVCRGATIPAATVGLVWRGAPAGTGLGEVAATVG
jgi:hypothetical protein